MIVLKSNTDSFKKLKFGKVRLIFSCSVFLILITLMSTIAFAGQSTTSSSSKSKKTKESVTTTGILPEAEFSLGGIRLGDNFQKIVSMYGKPTVIRHNGKMGEDHIKYAGYGQNENDITVWISLDAYDKVLWVYSNAPNGWKLPCGIEVGMPVSTFLDYTDSESLKDDVLRKKLLNMRNFLFLPDYGLRSYWHRLVICAYKEDKWYGNGCITRIILCDEWSGDYTNRLKGLRK